MTTFVNEQVKRLDTILAQSFEKNLQGSDVIKNFSSLNENDQFLFKASQALDLTSSTLPTFEKVQEYLDKYHERFSSQSSVIQSEVDPALEWLFVAKCTIAVYGQVFDKILTLTLPVSESIDYWDSIHGSSTQEIYYGLQSMLF
jgi:nuclear-control-of-ATPase protein 2